MKEVIQKVEEAVREFMAVQDKAHDWHHIHRVRTMALRIAAFEGGDTELIELAALVHDVGDYKFHESKEVGEQAAVDLMARYGVPQRMVEKAVDIMRRVSFKGLDVADDMPTLEGKIVQDADRLDAIGAIAIARTFTYGGTKGRSMHDPDAPLTIRSSEEYLIGNRSSIHHFFDKLLHLKNRLHTKTAREIATERHTFMEEFIRRFLREWDGK
ncbi:HD domain-containing protein [Candidatus Kaiserbacteria bacterium]|nr:HD domain-containing protein [Candidatus Kaiserbacteria bacterium]